MDFHQLISHYPSSFMTPNYNQPIGNRLCDEIKYQAFDLGIGKPIIPDQIKDNLRHTFWPWQEEALINFLTYQEIRAKNLETLPTHLLFNMATGSGKTMMMAALMLYYYQHSYRHFLFFVNQNNIVDKTEENFINPHHTKYLFKQPIIIDHRPITVRKVETFDDSSDLQIKFTSIHKLHNLVYLPRENAVTLDDFYRYNIVMLGDEAHNFNASTKKIKSGQADLDLDFELKDNASAEDVERSWEHTIIEKLLKKSDARDNKINKNVLLEFTATVPNEQSVQEKYYPKTIYKFDLKDFLQAGYTKEINLLSTNLEKKERMLLAVLFNWYRHQIALQVVSNFKPVILFRSKTIDDSAQDYQLFTDLISNLQVSDLQFLTSIQKGLIKVQSEKSYEQGQNRMLQMVTYINSQNIRLVAIVKWIQDNFAFKNCMITNSKDKSAKGQRGGEKTTDQQNQLLNNLEAPNNYIRAIFTVKRLTEGWDVLNLYDIVRLYHGRDEGKLPGARKAGQTTIQEVQLIGRGVRYYPFSYSDQEPSRRKFDQELTNPLRILEELFYHSEDDHRYISELKNELKKRGFITDERVSKRFTLKPESISNPHVQKLQVWGNKKIDNPLRQQNSLQTLKDEFVFDQSIPPLHIKEEHVLLDKTEDEVTGEMTEANVTQLKHKLADFDYHLVRKAINILASQENSFYRFDQVKEKLGVNTIDDLLSEAYLGSVPLTILAPTNKLDQIPAKDQLRILIHFFEKIAVFLAQIDQPYVGSPTFSPQSLAEIFAKPVEKLLITKDYNFTYENSVQADDWFLVNRFIGTKEEVAFFEEFKMSFLPNLRAEYDQVFLLRNEEVYKIYDFAQGRGFAPDFLLFLIKKSQQSVFQVFIEPKGKVYREHDQWKEDLMDHLYQKYGQEAELLAGSEKYHLIGLPFYGSDEQQSAEFWSAFEKRVPYRTE